MKYLAIIAFSFSLVSCASNPTAQSSTPFIQITDISSEGIFGKQLTLDNNYIVLNEDGSVNGVWANGPAAGTWEMRNGLWCRVYTKFAVADFVNNEDCQLFERSGDTIRATRDGGSGSSYLLAIK